MPKSKVVNTVQIRRRRSQTEVNGTVLALALNGANATTIVYGANIDFKRFKSLSINLVGKMLLTVEQDSNEHRKIYRTTERGKDLLNLLRKVKNII
jgi:predicted transcriptional regulator